MSYDISLIHRVGRMPLRLSEPHHMHGGTYAVGGEHRATLNITYNYAPSFQKAFGCREGVRSMYGLSGAESIPILKAAIAGLGDDVDPDYWKHTEGNAKSALFQLMALAIMRPDGEWEGD